MPLTDCVGAEFGAGGLGEIVVINTQSGAWPYLCGPSSASDLHRDDALGLWVPPRAVTPQTGTDTFAPSSSIPIGVYTDAFVTPPVHTLTNPSPCFPMQAVVTCELTITVKFTSADVWIKAIPWIGPSSATPPSVSGLPIYRTMHNLWTDAAAQNDSLTITLARRVGIAPGASVTLLVHLWLYAQGNPGSTVTATNLLAATDAFVGHGWLLTDGSQPVTDITAGTPAAVLSGPQKTAYVSQAVSRNPGQVDYLFQGTDNTLYVVGYSADTPYSTPASIGGELMASRPSSVSTQTGNADTFFLGGDGNLWHSASVANSAFSTPVLLGYGTMPSGPQAVGHQNGTMHVFWRGTDLQVWWAQFVQGTGWSASPTGLGGTLSSGTVPAPCVSAPGVTDVFFKGSDGHLWHVFTLNYGASWAAASSLGMGSIGQPKAVGHQDGTVQVFWAATVGSNVWYAQYHPTRGWDTSPTDLGGSIASGTIPWPVVSKEGTTDVFFEGSDGNLWHIYSTNYGSSWSAASSLGMGPVTQPHAVGQSSGNVDVFWKNAADAHVHTGRYTSISGWTGPTDLGGSAA